MTAFDKATDLPASINTLERLMTWCGLALVRVNPTGRVLEIPGANPEQICQYSFFRADDNSLRMAIRISVPISEDYAEGSNKFWSYAEEISNTVLPGAFTTD